MTNTKKEIKVQGLGAQIYSIELRDIFAAAALAGLLADPSSRIDEIVKQSYVFADGMLAARQA